MSQKAILFDINSIYPNSLVSKIVEILRKFQSDALQGFVIGKIEVKNSAAFLLPQIVHRKIGEAEMAIISSTLFDDVRLDVWLMLSTNQPINAKSINKKLANYHAKIAFDVANISAFQVLSQDNNYIHLNEKPVVQGLLQLFFIEKYLGEGSLNAFSIKFQEKLWADETLFLMEEGNKLLGMNDDGVQILEFKVHSGVSPE